MTVDAQAEAKMISARTKVALAAAGIARQNDIARRSMLLVF